MDLNYIENLYREDIKRKCPQLPDKIIEEYITLTFFSAAWATYEDNKDIYILGIVENKHNFYYIGCNEQFNIELISCSLDVKKNEIRNNDYIVPFNENFKLYSKESNKILNTIKKNIKEYLKTHKEDKLIYFRNNV